MDIHSHGLNDTFPEFNQNKIILRWGKVKYINGEYIDYYVTHDGLWHADDCAIIGNEKNGLAIRPQMVRRLNPVDEIKADWENDNGEYIVPYAPHPDYTDFDVAEWELAVEEYKNKTGIIWTPYEPDIHDHYVVIVKGSGCTSYVGDVSYFQSPQELSLGNGCQRFNTIVHEMGHAVGMWHTQSRSDRDNWVVVHFENIRDGTEGNFQKYENKPLCGGYDCSSAMHYHPFSFSKNGEKTITPIDESRCDISRDGLSTQDTICLNILYPTPSPTMAVEIPVKKTLGAGAGFLSNHNIGEAILIVFVMIFLGTSCLIFIGYSVFYSKNSAETKERRISQAKLATFIVDSNPSTKPKGTGIKQTKAKANAKSKSRTTTNSIKSNPFMDSFPNDGITSNTTSNATNKPMGLPKPNYNDTDTSPNIVLPSQLKKTQKGKAKPPPKGKGNKGKKAAKPPPKKNNNNNSNKKGNKGKKVSKLSAKISMFEQK